MKIHLYLMILWVSFTIALMKGFKRHSSTSNAISIGAGCERRSETSLHHVAYKAKQVTPAGLLQPLILSQIWEDISMGFITGLPISRGKSIIFVVVDRLLKYAHFKPLSHPYIAISVARVFFDSIFKLHGMPRSIICDQDPTFTSAFWSNLFKLNGTDFNYSSAYHPQMDGQSEVVNRTIEMYLRCFTSSQPKEWMRWLSWAEFCYNISWHSSTKKTPFQAFYGRPPPTLSSYIPGTSKIEAVEKELLALDQILNLLKKNISEAQSRMKTVYDHGHTERVFIEGDWVYLKLQP
ncbi:hypothetical protein Syun_021426 [Stephania yunnanensis]|uniref:Integrase catalytic domain-containing protein n=1 Tax=Stephania yunnanensis TaxID=152371 RepID=A0AAP0IFK2_9MAGN